MDRRIVYGAQVAVFLVSVPGFAAQRTFVASTGNDAQPCSLVLPCRGFQAAIAAADAGGEVVVLDSAGYGPFSVGKSISVIAPPGVYAGITAGVGQVGIDIVGQVIVRLSGLTVNGKGGTTGMRISGAEVAIERCTIERMVTGINIEGGRATIQESAIRWNSGFGIRAIGTRLSGERIRVEYNGAYGMQTESATTSHISDSVFAGNTLAGIGVIGFSDITLHGTNITQNQLGGIVVSGGGSASIEHSSVSGNTATGIAVVAFTPLYGPSRATISDSLVAGNHTGYGIHIDAPTGQHENAQVEITRSTITRNGLSGVHVSNTGPGKIYATVSGSQVSQNQTGLSVDGTLVNGTTRLVITGNAITNNGWGLTQSGFGVLITRTDNTVTDNAAQVSGTLTPVGGT